MTKRMLKSDQLLDAVIAFTQERAVSLSPTTICTDYNQFEQWIERCPYKSIHEGRKALTWVLQQEPHKAAQRVAMYLKCFFKWASSEDVALVPTNPVASFRLPKKVQVDSDIIVIPNSELPLVLASLERRNKSLPQWDMYARFMLQTGMRTGEVRALRVDDIDGQRILVHSNYTLTHGLKASTKTNRQRWVPLNAVAQQIIKHLAPVDGFLFPWNRHTFQVYFTDHMKRLAEAGVIRRRYRPYDLRHTAISMWLEAGVPVAQVAAWAGNTAQIIWAHYANTTNTYEIPVI